MTHPFATRHALLEASRAAHQVIDKFSKKGSTAASTFRLQSFSRNLTNTQSTYGNLTVSPNWSIDGLLDDQFTDNSNFGLDENGISVISALLTGTSILLLTDIVFRVIVRSRADSTTTHVIYRRSLLSQFSNPIEGLLNIIYRKRPSTFTDETQYEEQNGPSSNRIPLWHRGLIVVAGFLLLISQLLLIFLATNHTSPAKIDKRSIPSFEFSYPRDDSVIFLNYTTCSTRQLTSKTGFISQSSISLCAPVTFDIPTRLRIPNLAAVGVTWVHSEVHFTVITDHLILGYRQFLEIIVPDGRHFKAMSLALPEQAREVIPKQFERRGIPMFLNQSNGKVKGVLGPSWQEMFYFNLTNLSVPESLFKKIASMSYFNSTMEAANSSVESAVWNLYISSIARATLSPSGRSRAYFGDIVRGPFLDEYNGELVLRHRPWLTLVGCSILCGAILTVWVSVVAGIGWGAGVDERLAWMRVFKNVHGMDDFWTKPEEEVSFA